MPGDFIGLGFQAEARALGPGEGKSQRPRARFSQSHRQRVSILPRTGAAHTPQGLLLIPHNEVLGAPALRHRSHVPLVDCRPLAKAGRSGPSPGNPG